MFDIIENIKQSKENEMGNVIEFKKHTQQTTDCSSAINVNNKIWLLV